MKKHPVFINLAFLLGFAHQAHGHLQQTNLGTLTSYGSTLTASNVMLSGVGWLNGTRDALADSHGLPMLFQFSLSQAMQVRISANAYPDDWLPDPDFPENQPNPNPNPAFSIYSGLLPEQAHDGATFDQIAYVSFNSGFVGFNSSPRDRRPDDPLIKHFISVVDANGTRSIIENPLWNTPNSTLGGLTPAEWYQANYQAHDGYRDTMNHTQLGGQYVVTDSNGTMRVYPANYDAATNSGPNAGFYGQFDAFGSWSMANAVGEWSKAEYVSSASDTPCAGPNCISTIAGGFANPGHFSSGQSTSESMILTLAAGNYTIVIDDESCGVSACVGFGGLADLEVKAVPVPGAAGLFFSGLVAVFRMIGRTSRRRV